MEKILIDKIDKKQNIIKEKQIVSPSAFQRIMHNITLWFDSEGDDQINMESKKVNKLRILPFILIHVACLGVFLVGWSLTVVLAAVFFYFFRMFIITAFYHRYFAHRTFKTNRFWQFFFACLGGLCVQRGPLWWAAHHRHHHRHSDREEDTHSPYPHGFWWSHFGWFSCDYNFKTRYELVKDWCKYPELVFLNRYDGLTPTIFMILTFSCGFFFKYSFS